MAERAEPGGAFSQRTAWARSLETPLRDFLRTETGSAAFLLAATIAALVWVNVDAGTVMATVYSGHVAMTALLVAIGIVGAILVVRAAGVRIGLVYAVLGIATWVALFKSGVDPVVVGLVMGLLTYAYPAARADLERATDLFRLFREQPTPEPQPTAPARLRAPIPPADPPQQP